MMEIEIDSREREREKSRYVAAPVYETLHVIAPLP
jgi:hypothetical protein